MTIKKFVAEARGNNREAIEALGLSRFEERRAFQNFEAMMAACLEACDGNMEITSVDTRRLLIASILFRAHDWGKGPLSAKMPIIMSALGIDPGSCDHETPDKASGLCLFCSKKIRLKIGRKR